MRADGVQLGLRAGGRCRDEVKIVGKGLLGARPVGGFRSVDGWVNRRDKDDGRERAALLHAALHRDGVAVGQREGVVPVDVLE